MLLSPYEAERLAQERMKDKLRKAEDQRLLRDAGLIQSRKLPRPACRVLLCVGHSLVDAGHQLEHYAKVTLKEV